MTGMGAPGMSHNSPNTTHGDGIDTTAGRVDETQDREHVIEHAAQVIRAVIERQSDVVADGMHLDVQGVLTPHWIAEALATNGLLASAPLREEWTTLVPPHYKWEYQDTWDRREDAYVYGDESRIVRRYVSDWEPVVDVERHSVTEENP